MSKYTTEVRFICESLCELDNYNNVENVIANSVDKIFDFNFPVFDESYRKVIETKILKHYYTREIGEETVGLWKLRLNTRLNEIMPYYNKLYNSELLEFNPLYTANLTRKKKTDYDSNRNENENISDTTKNNGTTNSTNNSSVNGTGSGTSSNTGTDLYSDTPQGSLTGVENETYLTNARKTADNSTTSSTTSNTTNATGSITSTENNTYGRVRGNTDALTSTENYLETVIGFEGTNASDLLMKYRETFLNIDMMIINDLETLFFQLW